MSLTLIVPLPGTAVPLMNFIFLTLTALTRDTGELKGLPKVTQGICKKEY